MKKPAPSRKPSPPEAASLPARPQSDRRRAGRDAAHARALHDGAQWISPRDGADAVARRPRICRRGGEPRSRDGSGAPFRRLFISFALHRRLPADSRRRVPDSRPSCRAAMPRDGGDGSDRDRRALHPHLQDVRALERVGVMRTARDVSGLHHLFDAGAERRPNHDDHDSRRARFLLCERGRRCATPGVIVDSSGGRLRPARGIHRDDPTDQCD